MSEKNLHPFDRMIKESLENFEAPYQSSDWDQVRTKMGNTAQPGAKTAVWKGIALVSSALLVGVLAFFGLTQPDEKTTSTKQVAETTSSVEASETPLIETNSGNSSDTISTTKKDETTPISSETKTKKEKSETSENKVQVASSAPKKVEKNAKTKVSTTDTEKNSNRTQFTLSANRVCVKELVVLKPYDSIPGASYFWDFGNGEASTRMKPKYQYDEEGSYYISLTIKTKDNKVLASEDQQLIVNPKPKASFDYETTDFHCKNSSICFMSDIPEDVEYKWNFGDHKFSSEKNPKHTYYRKGHYNVKLTVTNNYGCSDSVLKQVYVMRAYNLLAPNSFSPNGDGRNDDWLPIALKTSDQPFDLKVVNANGAVVFTSTQGDQTWNGDLQTGGRAKVGEVYFWVAIVKDEATQEPTEYGGSIVISE